MADNYYTKTVADQKHGALDTKITNLTNEVTADKKNLADNYYTKTQVYSKTEVTDLHTGLESNFNEKYNSLSSEVTADKNNLKNNYYTKTQINTLHADMKKAAMTVVSTKPTSGEEGIIYLVGSAAPYHMWIWETLSGTGQWIDLGTSTIDLSGYAKKTDLDSYGKLDGTNTWTGNNNFVGTGGSAISINPSARLISYTIGASQYGIVVDGDGIKYVDSNQDEHSVVLEEHLNTVLNYYVLTTDLTNTLNSYAKKTDLNSYGKLDQTNNWTKDNTFNNNVVIRGVLNLTALANGIAMMNVSGEVDSTTLKKKTTGVVIATKEYVDGLAPVYATEAEINALFA